MSRKTSRLIKIYNFCVGYKPNEIKKIKQWYNSLSHDKKGEFRTAAQMRIAKFKLDSKYAQEEEVKNK